MKDKTNVKGDLVWVQFMDMHSGGGNKEGPYEMIYIEAADEESASLIFYNRFGHSPERVSCTCCGEDYSISSNKSLAQLTGYSRNCEHISGPDKEHRYLEAGESVPRGWKRRGAYGQYSTLKAYLAQDSTLVIHNSDVSNEEKQGDVPEQGYVWAG